MNIPVLCLTPPPRHHSVYSLSLLEAPRQGEVVDFSQVCIPCRPATGTQHHGISTEKVSASQHAPVHL